MSPARPGAPVRSAPLRRLRKRQAPAGRDDVGRDEAKTPGVEDTGTRSDSEFTEIPTESDRDAAAEHSDAGVERGDAGVEHSDAGVERGDAVAGQVTDADSPDSDVPDDAATAEQGLSYRERRQRRVGADPTRSSVRHTAPRGRTRRGSAVTFALSTVCVLVLIAAVVVAVVFGIAANRIDNREALRTEYSSFAQQVIVDLTSLNPKNVDSVIHTMQDKTSGRAQQQIRDSTKQAVELVRQQNLDTSARIISDAVTKADADEGTVLVVSGWEMKPPDPKAQPTVQTFRWRIDITRINDQLKMTNVEWVT